jgi:hypothetical protein
VYCLQILSGFRRVLPSCQVGNIETGEHGPQAAIVELVGFILEGIGEHHPQVFPVRVHRFYDWMKGGQQWQFITGGLISDESIHFVALFIICDVQQPGGATVTDALRCAIDVTGDLAMGSLIFRQRLEGFARRLDELTSLVSNAASEMMVPSRPQTRW